MAGEQIAVFIDWQNAYQAARRAFGMATWPNEYGNFSPYRLAKILAAGNDRGDQATLTRVEIHRGLPSSGRDPVGFAANRRQSEAWMAENREVVIPKLRSLRYPEDENEPPVEKGVDVNLALGAVEQILSHACDTVVIFSHDTDLLPAVEMIVRLAGRSAVETASWRSDEFQSRLRPRGGGVFHHFLHEEVFRRVETRINYAAPSR